MAPGDGWTGGEAPTFGDFIVYVDESGDHGLARMDPDYPVFVLAFCIFEKRALASRWCQP